MTPRRAQARARPGDRLRAIAARICRGDVMERVIDPLLADLQFEDGSATRNGARGRRLRVRLAAYFAFWKTLALCTGTSSTRAIGDWIAADEFAVGRTIAWSAAIGTLLTCAFALLPFNAVARRAAIADPVRLFVYLIPQAVPLSVVFGLPIGILVGLRGRQPTRRITWSLVALAAMATAITFVICAWVLPEANQSFRSLVFNSVKGRSGLPARGANELPFGELTARIAALQRSASPGDLMPFIYSFHARLAASSAPLIWGVFALTLASVSRRTVLSMSIFVVAAITFIAYATFIIDEHVRETFLGVPLAYVIWLPNLLFALATVALWGGARWKRRGFSG